MTRRKKCIFRWPVVIFTTLAILYIFFHLFYNSCGGHYYMKALCKEFEHESVAGSICANICQHKNFTLSSCTTDVNGYQIFHVHIADIKVESSFFLSSHSMDLSRTFIEPAAGVDMDQFSDMVTALIRERLGSGQHSNIIQDLMNLADANNNGKEVSLAEAKSVWSLLHQREFLMAFLLRHSSLASRLHGYCGNIFATDPLSYYPLYSLPSSTSWYSPLVLPYYRFRLPTWHIRAKHVISLLEFALELRGDSSESFHLCDVSIKNLGCDSKGDLKLLTFGNIYSRYEITNGVQGISCNSDNDCVSVSPDCISHCNPILNQCVFTHSNLLKICSIIAPYLRPYTPRPIAADVLRLLDRCRALNVSASNFDLQQNVVIGELKSLLWREISSTVN